MNKKKVHLTLLPLPAIMLMWLISWILVFLTEPKKKNERTRSDKDS